MLNKKILPLFLIIVALTLAGAGCGKTTNQETSSNSVPNNFVYYDGKDYGFEINYPQDWQYKEEVKATGKLSVYFLANQLKLKDATPFLNILAVSLDNFTNKDLKILADDTMAEIKDSVNDFKETTYEAKTFNGLDSMQALYTSEKDQIKNWAIIVKGNKFVYLINFTAPQGNYDSVLLLTQQMLKTLKIN